MSADPQIQASDPKTSVFVMANAGSGKTSTLVKRVARLLLRGAAPDAILCVTYTKAAAAEMQRRLFQLLGDWAVMEDEKLSGVLAALDEADDDLSGARALFARALETPGGLKIQTIHAFCEKLLKRFPLEAGVSPGFTVLEDAAAAEVSAQARDDVARFARLDGEGPLGTAYAYMSVQLDYDRFNSMFAGFESRRRAIEAYAAACPDGVAADVWRRCGFDEPKPADAIGAEAVAGVDWRQWKFAIEALSQAGAVTDLKLAAAMRAVTPDRAEFDQVWAVFCTAAGQPTKRLGTAKVDALAQAWLAAEQTRLGEACALLTAARMAEETVHALTLAGAYAALYEAAKDAHGGLDFGDLIARVHELLTIRADAAWVLYKLDGGIDHILVDEAQDTAPDQWDVVDTLRSEFFVGLGAAADTRTMFAVGDEKQSIYSFQGASPERFLQEAAACESEVTSAGGGFRRVPLLESWRSAPEILDFVDAVFRDPQAAVGLRPGASFGSEPIKHLPKRDPGGTVDLWPLEESEPAEEVDPWEPVDAVSAKSASRKLADRIAKAIGTMVARGETVGDRNGGTRPCRYGDFLILVRRRNTLFHEIIRAMKREQVAVGGADRLKLSEHVVFADLMALARFALFPGDELTLAALLRSPFCDVSEESLYDLVQPRDRRDLWTELNRRAAERPDWTAARDLLAWARTEAQRRAPFDFFGRAMARLDGQGHSMRARMLTRLGREAEDALDAFLAEVLKAEQRGLHDLESVVHAMASSEIEVKREQEESIGPGGGEVRVMTVHGAKGLEAPIVILPDTTTCVTPQGGPLLATHDGGFLWAPRKADDCEASASARASRDAAAQNESLRLLYVALTRARDRLIVCGVKTIDRYFKGSWREIIDRALADIALQPRLRNVAFDDGEQVIRYGAEPAIAAANDAGEAAATITLPNWTQRLAGPEPAAARYASPSTLAETDKGPAPSPLAMTGGLGRYRRGELIHRLLQLLPDIEALARPQAALSLLERERDLTPDQRIEMADAALGVLNDERFAAVFGPGSRAEVAIAGAAPDLPNGLAVSGRVDRLIVEPDRVLVVDFKTNRPSPDSIEDADRAYLVQMAVYVAVLRVVFPGRRIEAALVWTDGPKLMAIPEIIVAETLATLTQVIDRQGSSA